jgi:hypothetical protein
MLGSKKKASGDRIYKQSAKPLAVDSSLFREYFYTKKYSRL